jgi:hypothetical protein
MAEINNRITISDSLNKYDYLINKDDKAFIEVTEWINGEGFDIAIEREKESKLFSLTYGELDAINYLTQTMKYNDRKSK